MTTLFVKEIPIDLGAKHPDTPHAVLPRHEFSMGLIAPKGSGKTTLLCNLLHYYKHFFHSIIIFSPTVKNDEKWDWVKKQNLLVENKPLKKFFQDLKDKKEKKDKLEIVERPPEDLGEYDQYLETQKKDGKFDATIPEECFMSVYSSDDLKALLDEQQKIIDFLKEHGKTKHIANRILLLFDDLVGSGLFNNERTNPFKMLNTNHRHFSTSVLMVSQAYKEIPKTIRTNFTCLICFEIFSDGEIQAIMEEYPMGLKKDQWLEMYKYAVSTPHSFLFYNMQKKKPLRIMKEFKEILSFE